MSNEYYKNLPKKRMGSGVLILNKDEEILLVKPSYKNYWTVAGGVVEENESPRDACIREVKEEIGIDLIRCDFLCVDYVSESDDKGENLQFLFFGGKLDETEIKKIKIDGKEIVEYKFMSVPEALLSVGEKMKRRLPKCLEALKNDTTVYMENQK